MGRSTEEASSAVQSTEEASSAVQPASDNAEPRSASSAAQPASDTAAAQPLSSSAPHWDVDVFCSIEHLDAGGEIQPSKRCKYDGMMVSSKDFIVPKILQPIKAALAEEIEKFEVET